MEDRPVTNGKGSSVFGRESIRNLLVEGQLLLSRRNVRYGSERSSSMSQGPRVEFGRPGHKAALFQGPKKHLAIL